MKNTRTDAPRNYSYPWGYLVAVFCIAVLVVSLWMLTSRPASFRSQKAVRPGSHTKKVDSMLPRPIEDGQGVRAHGGAGASRSTMEPRGQSGTVPPMPGDTPDEPSAPLPKASEMKVLIDQSRAVTASSLRSAANSSSDIVR